MIMLQYNVTLLRSIAQLRLHSVESILLDSDQGIHRSFRYCSAISVLQPSDVHVLLASD